MAEQDLLPPARGDEGELFREFNETLLRLTARRVYGAQPETIEDACAFAWAQFLQFQPDRERNWKGWLVTTAQRRAWVLQHQARAMVPDPRIELRVDRAGADPESLTERVELREGVDEALTIVAKLPPRQQRVALLRALGVSLNDISQITGDSPTRVRELITRANTQIYEILAERDKTAGDISPRAARLQQLERDPPDWLVQKIGRPVRPSRKFAGRVVRQRAWRRAAMALDDYRTAAGDEALATMTEAPPTRPGLRASHTAAVKAIDAHEIARLHERGGARER